MHETVLADVEVARSGAAAPVVGLAVGDGFLELVEAGIIALLPVAHLEIDAALFVLKRLELAVPVMDDADCRGEAEFQSTASDHQGVVRVLDAAAYHRVDVDV